MPVERDGQRAGALHDERFDGSEPPISGKEKERMSQPYALEIDAECRHGNPLDHATVSRVPFGNEVKWQIRIYYDCEEGCHVSEVREDRPTRILNKSGEEVPTREP